MANGIMSARSTRLLLIFGAFLAGLVLCFAVIMLVIDRTAPQFGRASAIGGPFKLVSQEGRTVTEQDFKGRPFLVFFGFTHCPEVCPVKLFEISQVLRKLGPDADRVAALLITVDPARDTPAKLKDYLSNFDKHLVGLTGDAAAIAKVAKEYRVFYRKVPLKDGDYTMDHTALVYLMDKQGRFVAPFNLKRTPEAAAAELRKYF